MAFSPMIRIPPPRIPDQAVFDLWVRLGRQPNPFEDPEDHEQHRGHRVSDHAGSELERPRE